MTFNIQDYANDGWGISVKGFKCILDNIKNIKKNKIRVLEFGSGISTRFLVDVRDKLGIPLEITSFEDNKKWAHELSIIRPLIECSKKSYDLQFSSKSYDRSLYSFRKNPPASRQKNCFYDLKEEDITGCYDFIILDGPHGNGRNIAWLHLKDHLSKDSMVFIDDFDHYDFVPKFRSFFKAEEIQKLREKKDRFILFKITD